MDEHEERTVAMAVQTQQTRREFLTAELTACFSAAAEARQAIQSELWDAAEEKLRTAEKGYAIIVRSLAELDDEQQRADFKKSWDALRSELDDLQVLVKDSARN